MKNNKRNEEEVSLEFENQKIVDIPMGKEVKTSFIDYAMSVIMARALPDARDGLKPVHRRILYAMYEDHLTYDKPFHKSAATVGNVLGRYHPHGDMAVYDSMVRLAQPFSLRYPLIEGHGNFGNIDGDQPAAYRYTEARMSRLSDEMLRDIKKETVDFGPNFDSKLREPLVLPSRFPNLLVNGSVGIAVGMATNIPPHNLGEICDGINLMLDNPDVPTSELMEVIKGPDFPTGAMIMGTMGIAKAYATGKGHITVRARANVEEDKRRIIITEIPYAVNKAALVEAMADCVKDKKIEGVTALRDESGRDGMRIVVEYRHDANGQLILNQFYKYTQLQDTFAVNMLALVDNIPKILTLRDALALYIKHQEDVIIRRTRYDLDDASREAHLNEGFKFAIDNIDRVIAVIRASNSTQDAKVNLMNEFSADNVENFLVAAGAVHTSGVSGLTDAQAQAIVEMPLGRLAGMERAKIDDRLHALYEKIKELELIIADESLLKGIIRDELAEIRRRFADERRTEIVPAEDELVPEDLIERHRCVLTLTHTGYIKRLPADTYSAQRRGGKGVIGMATKDEDAVEKVLAAHSHSDILMFTNLGRVHTIKCYRIPEASRTSRGSHTINLLDLTEGEKVTAMISVTKYDEGILTLVTKHGEVRRTALSEFEYQRKGGKIAFNLEDGDELLFARITSDGDELLVASDTGRAVRFALDTVTLRSRSAGGVRAIMLDEGESVAGAAVVRDGEYLMSVTENGFGKRTSFDEFPTKGRGGKGMIAHGINEKTGRLAGLAPVHEDDDVMLITADGNVIRFAVSDVSIFGRPASGVRVMRTGEDTVVNFAVLTPEADDQPEPEPDVEPIEIGDAFEDEE